MNSCSPEVESLQGLETSSFMLALKSLNGDFCHLWQWGRLLKSTFQQFPVGLVHSQQKLSESRYLFIDLFRG